jgi:exodeoxyribonuclease III
MKIVSWNVNGLRAITKKTFFTDFELLSPDLLCMQEIKAQEHHVAETLEPLNGYHIYSNSANKPGYSGTAVISKIKPLSVTKGMNIMDHDTEARVLCLELETFFLVNVYVPNSGSELKRLGYRQDWDKAFFNYLKNLEKIKSVIVCGDFNVAHKAVDIARPKANYNKTAGYMQQEIDGMDRFVGGGLADTFRRLHPDEIERYSWWSYRAGTRSKNIGWRIDYFLVSEFLLPSVTNAFIREDITGSDHCPVGIELKMP